MFLAQARTTPGIHVMAVADLSAPRALQALRNTGWVEEQISAASFKQALSSGTTHVTEDAEAMIAADGVDVIVEATGNPIVGIHHALRCFYPQVEATLAASRHRPSPDYSPLSRPDLFGISHYI
jgi:predicted homoserine dehydrogenase-like protein